ncbi:UDP-glucose/GDP-mannose dehydrogenase family protein [Candidatus Pacearchaeota archaeon]|nr:UDP-glucose/GDP-mannose dehydrogenase family protein [Candidatus Pacearchaeota archaeon]
MKNISIIGAGYVGLVTAACFAELGHKVKLLEIDPEKLRALEHGILPISEPDLPILWQRNRADGRISITDHYIEGLLGAEFVFIAVGTPSTRNGKPDLKWVRLAAKSIAEAASGPMFVVLKSTVPVGTTALVTKILARYGRNGHSFPVVSNPEFLREGHAVFDFMHPTRIVVGSTEENATNAVARLYKSLNSPLIICDSVTAEMSKYASNVFLATRISFMNEIALLCDEYGVDIVKVAEIMGMDPRFGSGYLNAGLGWGGSCLPKDVRGLIYMAKNHGIPLRLVRSVQLINQQQPKVVIGKLYRLLGSLEGKTIGVLGLSFKPNSDDMREASSLALVSLLKEQKCRIKAYDPLAMKTAAKLMCEVTYCADAYEVAKNSDALILVTEWDEFKELDMQVVSSLMNRPIIIDGRNLYDPDAMIQAGFIYEGIGHRSVQVQEVRSSIT